MGRRFDHDPRLAALVREVTSARDAAFERFSTLCGLEPRPARILWRLDTEPGDPSQRPEAQALEHGRTEVRDGRIVVTLPAYRFLAEPARARTPVTHEVGHAALASVLEPAERYLALPRWFREGFALLFAEEGETALADDVAATLFAGGDPSALAVGVLAAGDAPRSAAESYLVTRWLRGRLEARARDASWEPLIRGLVAGGSLEETVSRLAGATWSRLAEAGVAAARRRLEPLVPETRAQVFRRSLELRAGGDTPRAAALWRELLAENEDGPLATTLLYLLAHADLSGGGDAGARRARARLERLLGTSGELWRPEAFVLLGDCARADGDPGEARGLWQRALEAYPDDRAAARRARERLREDPEPRSREPGDPGRVSGASPR